MVQCDSPHGGGALWAYRLYFMDRYSGHIEHRREFIAEDDAAAIAIASGWSTGQPMELWLGSHKLKRWEAATPSSQWALGAAVAPQSD